MQPTWPACSTISASKAPSSAACRSAASSRNASMARGPDLIEGLILCDTAAKIGTAEMWNGRIEATLSRWHRELCRRRHGKMVHAGISQEPRRRARRLQDHAGAPVSSQVMRPPVPPCAMRTTRADALSIGVPTLCIVGDQDGSTPPDLVESFARSIPGARFEVISGAGHIPCVEQPEKLAELIRGFMEHDMKRRRS